MPILYEDTFQKKKTRKYALVTDTNKSVTVTLAAGKGTLLTANAFDATGMNITKAAPGQGVGLSATIRNDGDDDYLWARVTDKDTGAVVIRKDGIPCQSTNIFIKHGLEWGPTFAAPSDLDMPNKNWNLLFEAGHGQP